MTSKAGRRVLEEAKHIGRQIEAQEWEQTLQPHRARRHRQAQMARPLSQTVAEFDRQLGELQRMAQAGDGQAGVAYQHVLAQKNAYLAGRSERDRELSNELALSLETRGYTAEHQDRIWQSKTPDEWHARIGEAERDAATVRRRNGEGASMREIFKELSVEHNYSAEDDGYVPELD